MNTAKPEFEQLILLDKVRYVVERSRKLLRSRLDEELEIDYVSAYPETEEEYAQACQEAERRGSFVYNKNGNVYVLEGVDTPNVVRIRKPWPTNGQVGCVDFVVDDYAKIRNTLLVQDGVRELRKGEYDILEVTDLDFDVAIYFPSQRMTEFVMGIRNPR